jgi:hypothetical protein
MISEAAGRVMGSSSDRNQGGPEVVTGLSPEKGRESTAWWPEPSKLTRILLSDYRTNARGR